MAILDTLVLRLGSLYVGAFWRLVVSLELLSLVRRQPLLWQWEASDHINAGASLFIRESTINMAQTNLEEEPWRGEEQEEPWR